MVSLEFSCAGFIAACFSLAGVLHAQDLVIYDEYSGNGSPRGFYSVDPDTGTISLLTTVAPTVDRLNGFAYRPADGMVYAGGNRGRIWRIDPGDGQAEIVGDSGLDWIRGLTFSPLDGTLYGMGFGATLYTIDPVTAAVAAVGLVPDLDAGLAASTDGMLYGQRDYPKDLLAIDPQSLATTTINISPSVPPLSNFAFTSEGRLFGVNWQWGALYEIDPVTGQSSELARYTEHMSGMIGVFSIPEPGAIVLCLTAAIGVLRRHRRSGRR